MLVCIMSVALVPGDLFDFHRLTHVVHIYTQTHTHAHTHNKMKKLKEVGCYS